MTGVICWGSVGGGRSESMRGGAGGSKGRESRKDQEAMPGPRTQVGGEEAQGRVGQNHSLRLGGLATSGSSFFNRRAARKRGEDVGGEVWLPPPLE